MAPHCLNMQEELANYRWRDTPGGRVPVPEGEDHLIDALRYALEGDSMGGAARCLSRKII